MSCYAHREDPERFVDIFNRTVAPVVGRGRLSTHLCFGNYHGHAVGPRRYAPMFPAFNAMTVDEIHVEMASRELAELDVIATIAEHHDVAVGIVDVKSYFVEPPELIAERVRECLKHAPAGAARLRPRLRAVADGALGGQAEARQPRRRRAAGARGGRDDDAHRARPARRRAARRHRRRASQRRRRTSGCGGSARPASSCSGDGSHLLLDPYLSDSLTAKYAATDKPHVRLTARAVDPQSLDMIDVVTSSHNHTDHLDHETLWPLLAANPALTLVIPEANRAFVADRLRTDPAWPTRAHPR